MVEISEECTRFKTTNQRRVDQARTMIKKGWVSELEILELPSQIYKKTYQQAVITLIETLNTEKSETFNETEHTDPERPQRKGTDPNNYRSITCLPMIRKILTAPIREI